MPGVETAILPFLPGNAEAAACRTEIVVSMRPAIAADVKIGLPKARIKTVLCPSMLSPFFVCGLPAFPTYRRNNLATLWSERAERTGPQRSDAGGRPTGTRAYCLCASAGVH